MQSDNDSDDKKDQINMMPENNKTAEAVAVAEKDVEPKVSFVFTINIKHRQFCKLQHHSENRNQSRSDQIESV